MSDYIRIDNSDEGEYVSEMLESSALFEDTEENENYIENENKRHKKIVASRIKDKNARHDYADKVLRCANGAIYIYKHMPDKSNGRRRKYFLSNRSDRLGKWWSTHIEDAAFYRDANLAKEIARKYDANVDTYLYK